MYVHTRERDIRLGFDGVKIKCYYYYYLFLKNTDVVAPADIYSADVINHILPKI